MVKLLDEVTELQYRDALIEEEQKNTIKNLKTLLLTAEESKKDLG